MVRITRKYLAAAAAYIDTNNPKFELDYLFIDSENMVSTNTRALAVVKHYSVEKFQDFYIHKSIVDLAIKQTKAKSFELSLDKIICYDKDDFELLIISKSPQSNYGRYPEYKRILPPSFDHTIPFLKESHIDGIFALNKVLIDNKNIPKLGLTKEDSEFLGYIGINSDNLPVSLFDVKKDIQCIIMPIIENNLFPDLKEK